MQVILLKDVARVGRRYDVVNVSNGYANNFLFPRRLAELASKEKVAGLEKLKETARAAEDAKNAEMREKLTELAGVTVTIEVKADENGHLFKKIRAENIADVLSEEHGLAIPKEAVLLETPLHELGEHEVEIELAGERTKLIIGLVTE
jgi:large subunit ribosomal protein L9